MQVAAHARRSTLGRIRGASTAPVPAGGNHAWLTNLVQYLLLVATASVINQGEGAGAQSVAAEQNLLLGAWQLDLAKSRYVPGPPPRSETRTYVRDKDGMKGTIRRQRDEGGKR